MGGERFDPSLLDANPPFEVDERNRPHLAKHAPVTEDDLTAAWSDPEAIFIPAAEDGPADWLLVARLPGGLLCRYPSRRPLSERGNAVGRSASIRLRGGRSTSTRT